MASLHAFALRQSLNLYITHYKRPFAYCQIPLSPVVLVFLTKSLPRIKDHKWFAEFNTIDICRTFRRLLRPEAHMSIRYDTAPDCHNQASLPFWLMCINLLSHVASHDPLGTSPFGSPCVLFPGSLGLSGSSLHRFVL